MGFGQWSRSKFVHTELDLTYWVTLESIQDTVGEMKTLVTGGSGLVGSDDQL